MPVFNQEQYIGRCIRSLLSLNYPRDDYEIILINDGSTDHTMTVVNAYRDELKIVINSSQSGLPAALNKGIKLSKGKHIVRLDGDDYVNEYFIFLLHTYLEQNKYMDAIACDYLLVDNKEEVISRENCIDKPIGCGIMFKSNQLLDIGLYDEDFRLHEERELRHRFEKKYKIHRLELPLYRYRRHEKNITNNAIEMSNHEKKLKEKHSI